MKKNTLYCPLFNEENIWQVLQNERLPFDSLGLFRPLEMVMFPHQTVLTSVQNTETLKILFPEHSQEQPFFALKRFFASKCADSTRSASLNANEILENLTSYLGLPYVWGGNWVLSQNEQKVLEEMFDDQPNHFINNLKYLFSGLDCSGLLYAATQGSTPRNTSQLIAFGKSLIINDLSIDSILQMVKPLDLLVWKGHVLIFLNNSEMIESRHPLGVIKVSAKKRLEEIFQERRPKNTISESGFVINRWIDS